ncbi:unnamed protein product [Cuscuta campestris]|uniref:Ubiquitin-like protease family profile domain-containing protein n=1 Tax=Cuscuta campestris TaxID=132261 RepID=A0A484NC99_9ASTE|nr:unnamed protein product [Cuscuta campestris]
MDINQKLFLPSLQMFLPKLMDKLGVCEGREEGSIGDGVLAIEAGSCFHQKNDGSRCGMFVVKMVEFLMIGHNVRDMDDHKIAAYRKKMTTELLAYFAMLELWTEFPLKAVVVQLWFSDYYASIIDKFGYISLFVVVLS